MLMVDSTVWIDYFNGVVDWRTDYLDAHVTLTPILISDLILAKVLQGFRRNDGDFDGYERHLGLKVVRA
ncbi:MAG TPA: hypothetical protein DCL15_12555 [Chloroflexi bacterium]|nr:hypothetical protein [Chloroflexota bacterium]HHW84784.1 PIN domain nuclease [Chloroflexota bacterium]